MPNATERPAITLAMIDGWLGGMDGADGAAALQLAASGTPFILGRRGFAGPNQRGAWDDALVLVVGAMLWAFHGNTDPSVARTGIATLVPGVYRYKLGIHGLSKPVERQYPALVQAAPVTVTRDGGKSETGYFGVNIHRGGQYETTSEGCQTVRKDQWPDFYARVKDAMTDAGIPTIAYVLTAASE